MQIGWTMDSYYSDYFFGILYICGIWYGILNFVWVFQ